MTEEQYDLREMVSRLKAAHYTGYLLGRGWQESPSRYKGHIFFTGKIHDHEDAYELYMPTPMNEGRYRNNLMRGIYKLCGIEDREPAEIVRDMLETKVAPPQVEAPSGGTARLRVRNNGSTPLQLRIDSPAREHSMLPGEAIELVCDVNAVEMLNIERGEQSITIRAMPAG